MTYEETLRFLTEQVDKYIDVTVSVPTQGINDTRPVASFSGQANGTSLSGARRLPEAWNVWLKETPGTPSPVSSVSTAGSSKARTSTPTSPTPPRSAASPGPHGR